MLSDSLSRVSSLRAKKALDRLLKMKAYPATYLLLFPR